MKTQQNNNNPKQSRQIFSTKSSDSFVSYEHSVNPLNVAKGLEQFKGTNLGLWAFGASRFGHIETAQKQAQKIKEGKY